MPAPKKALYENTIAKKAKCKDRNAHGVPSPGTPERNSVFCVFCFFQHAKLDLSAI
jgi:hypothetical protein